MTGRAVDLHADIAEVLLTEEQISTRVAELGARTPADHQGQRLTLVSVLKGSLPFMADLMRAIDLPLRIDLMEVSSYGGGAPQAARPPPVAQGLSLPLD